MSLARPPPPPPHPSTVADPGFSRGGATTAKLGLFCKFFAENCMKMKEFGPGGARPWRPLLDLPMVNAGIY